jgi:hypothetical protein
MELEVVLMNRKMVQKHGHMGPPWKMVRIKYGCACARKKID